MVGGTVALVGGYLKVSIDHGVAPEAVVLNIIALKDVQGFILEPMGHIYEEFLGFNPAR